MVRWMSFLAAGTALAGCTMAPPPEVAAPVAPVEAAPPVEQIWVRSRLRWMADSHSLPDDLERRPTEA